jgi:UDPglucose--hexose-1-phosphate uridylyltransferase
MPKTKFASELRFDLVSGDWVVIATGRARRPETFKKDKKIIEHVSPKDCVFCNLSKQEKPLLVFYDGEKIEPTSKGGIPKRWSVVSVPNKYPAFTNNQELQEKKEGPYHKIGALGFHEVVITRDHRKQIARFSQTQIKELIDVYQSRYLSLMKEKFVNYVSIFHNHGPEAGASIAHPHSQIIAIPIMDPDIQSGLDYSRKFFKKNKKCAHCLMSAWDIKNKSRIVFENKDFVALCPFASRMAFEVVISPKQHSAYFERTSEKQKWAFAEILQIVMHKLYKGLNNPPYNFFIHTAPCDGKDYDFYHWHLCILPKTSTWAGFELCTGIEISTIEPEKAAEYLRKQ